MSKLAIRGGKPLIEKPIPSWPQSSVEGMKRLKSVLESQKWGLLGPEVTEFTKRYGAYCDANYAVATSNGTISLELILRSLNIGRGDEVIIPSYTFVATASAVVFVGATPIFADTDENTYNIDPNSIEENITPNTKAIIAVHVGGRPCDMDELLKIAKKHDLYLIEDAAQAHGSEWKRTRVGAIGDAGSFSFQASKNLSCGEGGAVVTNNEEIFHNVWSIHHCGREFGNDSNYNHPILGTDARMSEWQAAILNDQMNRLDADTEKRMENAKYLTKRLQELDFIETLYDDPRITRNSYHLYVFKYKKERCKGLHRDIFVKALKAEGVSRCETGYSLPIYKMEFLNTDAFRKATGSSISYKDINRPANDLAAYEQGAWLYHAVLLGEKED
ncbi:MAG: DegT/DnrJ/EryC1/StrS family aminotransferase, partial [Erysipelothrix sp.]|nr:DegT/DnrJ/EryC1/StrS family aminotransferase [Erysipelothrix sp.]